MGLIHQEHQISRPGQIVEITFARCIRCRRLIRGLIAADFAVDLQMLKMLMCMSRFPEGPLKGTGALLAHFRNCRR